MYINRLLDGVDKVNIRHVFLIFFQVNVNYACV